MHSVLPWQSRLDSQTLAQSESGEEQLNPHLPAPMSAFVVPGGQPQSACPLQSFEQTPLLEQRFESQSAFAAQAAPIVPKSAKSPESPLEVHATAANATTQTPKNAPTNLMLQGI